jgi:hypothetical protein
MSSRHSSAVTTGYRATVKLERRHGFDVYLGRVVALDAYGVPCRVVYRTSAWSQEGCTVQLQRRLALIARYGESLDSVLKSLNVSADKAESLAHSG